MKLARWVFLWVFLWAILSVLAEDGGQNDDDDNQNDDGNAAANDDGAAANDDGAEEAEAGDDDNNNNKDDDEGAYVQQYGDDVIQSWGQYALLPRRCIVYNDVDVIVFSVFEHSYRQCSEEAKGTYVIPVPYFMGGLMEQNYQDAVDQGLDDYVAPDSEQYIGCVVQEIQNQEYYLRLGCADGDSLALAVNIYSDNTCTERSVVDGYDDSNIDISDLEVAFKRCRACVNWVDVNDDQYDDQFYENRAANAPLCSTAWQYKEECNRQCQKIGLEKANKEGWNTSDKILLAILSMFGAGMLIGILQKRRMMSNKDALLEQAAMSAAGLQLTHVIGIFALIVLVITVFALLGLKNITWALLLIINTVLFGYLMKLTIDSGVSTGETIIGPDGTIIHQDSDDSSVQSDPNPNAGTYKVPNLT